MTYQNAQFKNSGNDEGDILNFFNNHLRTLVQKNGGDNTFSIVEELCHDKDETIPLGTKTKIRLTHSGHTISQIEKSFIEMTVQLALKFTTKIDANSFYEDKKLDHRFLNLIFVGFKDAVEIIQELQFWVDGKLLSGYHQSEMMRESFAYNCIRPKDDKTNASHSHSLWESVMCMSPNVAGCYIPLYCFENEKLVTVEMKLIIPFTDQLALQAWRLYPNRILGEMEEEVKFCLDSLVWCQIPPENVSEIKKFWTGGKDMSLAVPHNLAITNHFTQIKNSAIIVKKVLNAASDIVQTLIKKSVPSDVNKGNFTVYELGVNTLEYEPSKCSITRCRSNCAGFGVKPDVIESLMTTLQEPIIIPSQELTRFQFEHQISTKNISISKSVPLKNATNITMMFPSKGDVTCYKNVMMKSVRLSVNKKKYPETEFDKTWDARFVQYQLMANELEGNIEPTNEFVESISRPLNYHFDDYPIKHSEGDCERDFKTDNTRFLMCPFDNTSFGINFQLERGNSGYVFDGVDTGNQAVAIEFKGDMISNDDTNTYYYPDLKIEADDIVVNTDSKQNPIPEMWVCSDTYWTWSIQDGVQYYPRGRPTGYD